MLAPETYVVESQPLNFMLSVPEAPQPRPVLCFLHGYDEAAPLSIQEGVTRHGPLKPNSARTATREFIVIAPQLPRRGDIWYQFADSVREIVERVQVEHSGDKQRTYLTGFSFGGNGVFDLALLHRDLWAALWPVDPTRIPREDPARPVWLSVGEAARRGTSGFARALELEPVSDSLDGDRLYLDEGEDHVGSARSAYGDQRVYTWLLGKRSVAPVSGGPV